MRILWLCNTPLSTVAKRFGTAGNTASWLVGISGELKKERECELCIVFPQTSFPNDIRIKESGIYYIGLYKCDIATTKYSSLFERKLEACIREWKADIVHIFGTEYIHSLEMVNAARRKVKVVISIQGLISVSAEHYNQGILHPNRVKLAIYNNKLTNLVLEQKKFARRGKSEIEAIKKTDYIIGRTDWDYACVKRINPNCKYYKCNETMRDSFYSAKWDISKIRRNSLFISQGNYSIKGFHYMVRALAIIKRKYPHCVVIVSGSSDFICGKNKSPYGRYIEQLISKYHLWDSIHFLGYHSEENMVSRLLESHVYVLCSNIENSPNSVGEAMLVGTPTVAGFVGGMINLMEHGTEGFLYQHDATYMLAHYVQKIFENDELAMQLSRAGREKARILYDRAENKKNLLKIYRNIINET